MGLPATGPTIAAGTTASASALAAPPAGSLTCDSIDEGVKTTIRSIARSADLLPPGRLKLRMRFVGGDVGGGPLPIPTTNTFEQTVEKLAGDGLQMIGNPPIPSKAATIR